MKRYCKVYFRGVGRFHETQAAGTTNQYIPRKVHRSLIKTTQGLPKIRQVVWVHPLLQCWILYLEIIRSFEYRLCKFAKYNTHFFNLLIFNGVNLHFSRHVYVWLVLQPEQIKCANIWQNRPNSSPATYNIKEFIKDLLPPSSCTV